MNTFPKGKVAFFVTTNIHKFNEAQLVFAKYKIATAMLKIEAVEIQHDNLENIAKASAIDAVEKCGLPIIVEDAGLFIKHLNGFPGPYSSYVYRTIGNKGIIKLMGKIRERNAYFQSVVAFHSPEEKSPRCFHGKVEGKISHEERGTGSFGFDPIFEPFKLSTRKAGNKTFGEMTLKEKNRHSHRAQALQKFVKWYKEDFK
ncbi:MAG: XTP/dITP diphosphatase [Thermoproteota archaeon]|nr:XTP/dITP diphosphatase [Thermoproteota archaeon]